VTFRGVFGTSIKGNTAHNTAASPGDNACIFNSLCGKLLFITRLLLLYLLAGRDLY
jgi:hypothetical protein